jgi:hypothetical protein
VNEEVGLYLGVAHAEVLAEAVDEVVADLLGRLSLGLVRT